MQQSSAEFSTEGCVLFIYFPKIFCLQNMVDFINDLIICIIDEISKHQNKK